MKKVFSFFSAHVVFISLLLIVLLGIFWPIFIKGQVPFSANLLGSFFNPFAQEKFLGWEQGIPNKPTGIDDLRIFYPQRHFTDAALLLGQIPFWNPYNHSGNYQVGLSETAVFYPLFFVFFFLPQVFAWTLLILIEPILVGVGMYLYLRTSFADKKFAAFGAIVFAFSGIVIVRSVEGLSVGHTLLWLPYAFYGIEAFFEKKKIRYLLFTLFALCLSILAGWFQFTFYIFAFSFLYVLFKLFTSKFSKKTLFVFLPFLLTPFLTLFHIIPAFETLSVSPRGIQSISQILHLHLMPVSHIFTFLFPDLWGNPGTYTFFGKSEYKESILYIGIIPFILSLFSFANFKNKFVVFFSISGIVSLFLGLDTQITKKVLSLPLPIISTFLPNRIFLITTFSFAVLSVYGLSVVYNIVSKKTIACVSVIVLLTLFAVDGYIAHAGGFSFLSKYHFLDTIINSLSPLANLKLANSDSQLHTISRVVLFPQILIVLFFFAVFASMLIKKPKVLFISAIFLTIIGQVYFAQRYIPFSNPQFMYPQHQVFSYLQKNAGINRFISTQEGYISSNIPLFYNLYSPDGVGSMYIARYGELVKYMQSKGESYKDIPRIETRIDPSQDELFTKENPYLLKFMQIDGVKYVVTLKKDSLQPQKDFSLVREDKQWQIYSYANVLPRFFLTSSYIVEKNQKKELETLFNSKTNPKTLLLEENPGIGLSDVQDGMVKITSYQPNLLTFKTSMSVDSLLYISDTYSPNFIAYVDTKPVKLLRANYAFRAVVVPQGDHTVVLQYQDSKETLGFMIAGGTLLVLIFGVVFLYKTKKGL